MTEPSRPESRKSGRRNSDKKPSKWWVAVLVLINFAFVEAVFLLVGLTLAARRSGEAMEAVALDAMIFVPLAFAVSLCLLIPILRIWQLRNQVWAASVGSWLPGVAIGVLFYCLGTYTRFFQIFMPIAKLLE